MSAWLVAASGLSWMGLSLLALACVVCLLGNEWQQRRTLMGILREAPEGTVIRHDRNPWGSSTHVRLGGSDHTRTCRRR